MFYKTAIHIFRLGFVLVVVLICFNGISEEQAKKRPLALITNLENPINEISLGELERIYLKKKKYWINGERCIPIDQPGSSESRTEFYRLVLKKNPYEMQRYWMQETMTGNATPPVTLDNSAIVKRYIQKIKGGVGYIYADELDDSVKALHVTDSTELGKRHTEESEDADAAKDDTETP